MISYRNAFDHPSCLLCAVVSILSATTANDFHLMSFSQLEMAQYLRTHLLTSPLNGRHTWKSIGNEIRWMETRRSRIKNRSYRRSKNPLPQSNGNGISSIEKYLSPCYLRHIWDRRTASGRPTSAFNVFAVVCGWMVGIHWCRSHSYLAQPFILYLYTLRNIDVFTKSISFFFSSLYVCIKKVNHWRFAASRTDSSESTKSIKAFNIIIETWNS